MLSLTTAIIILNLALGTAIWTQSKRGLDARIFFFITLVFSALTVANHFSLTTHLDIALYWVRINMFLAAWHTFLFFIFVHVFAKEDSTFSLRRSAAMIIPFSIILIISISPYLFSDISLNADGLVKTSPGILFPLYAFWLISTIFLSIRQVVGNFRRSTGILREQWKYLLIGSFSTYTLLVIFNFIIGGLFQNTQFLEYTPVFSLPIVFATAYAVIKHNLFDIKVLATQAFVTIISLLYLMKVIMASTNTDRAVDGVIFVISTIFGVLLIRSVKDEVRAREKISTLAVQLTETNKELSSSNERLRILDQRKSEFVSIASHQLRTPVTAIKGYSSLMLENSYGVLPKELKDPVKKIFLSSQRLVDMINDFLNVSKIEQGTMSYSLGPVDIGAMISELSDDFVQIAKNKKLEFAVHVPENDKFIAIVDDGKIRQIVSNLIDNSIKYTPTGKVNISLLRDEKGKIIIKLTDTGIGLSQDDIHHLFGKFTRGTGGQRQNTDGSGLGLYVAKGMLEAQGGRIYADSEGPSKGSTFIIELNPASKECEDSSLPK